MSEDLPPVPVINDTFITYYKNVYVPHTLSEEEFEKMIEIFKTQLPTVFRVIKNGHESEKVQNELNDFIKFFKENNVNIETIDYIPNDIGTIYKLSLDKKQLRRNEKFGEFHEWLKLHTELGHTHRQEFVSMVPPFFLDIKESMSVLDTCAAPGSKTAQIIEMLSGDGFVVANDNDIRRCHPMVHQLQRVGTSRTMVVNFDGQKLPDFGVQFDRVLCDVPCSCDGTIRKNIKAAERFELHSGNILHHTQKKILLRGLELTKVGGLCVYSTCSMNPIEDEAVVNSVLLQLDGAVEILDVSNIFPELKRHKGLTYWPVYDSKAKGFIEYKTFEDVPKDRVQFAHKSLFPQPQVQGLEHCMHFFPQDQDSGGFFVTVLKKVKEFEPISEKGVEKKPLKEAPYHPIMESAPEVMNAISETYGFSEDFPKDCFFVRNDNKTKHITYCVKPLADIVTKIGSVPLRVVNLGATMFTYKSFGKDTEKVMKAYPTIEGIFDVMKFAHKQIFYLQPKDMFTLLYENPNTVGYSRLSEESQKQFEGAALNGAGFTIKGTSFAYGGMSFANGCVVYVTKDIIKHEIEKLKQSYPELVEYEKELAQRKQQKEVSPKE